MCSRGAFLLAGAAVLGSLLGMGCHACTNHEKAEKQFELAEYNYQNQKFDQAKRIYMNALENCPELEGALVGLGNACREYGTDLYHKVDQLAAQGNKAEAERVFKDANENHGQAHKCFEEALKRNPDDLAPHYGLALLWYQRATSPWPYPYPFDDRRRVEERDRAIAEFERLVKEAPDLYQAHRYLGLCLFVAGRMDEGRPHLKLYHDYQQRWYNVVMSWPQQSSQQKTAKEQALAQVEREIDDVREVLRSYYDAVRKGRDELGKKPTLTPEEKGRLALFVKEQLQLEEILRTFVVTKLGPAELEVWHRCQLYLSSINRGVLDDVLRIVWIKPGEDFVVRQKVAERVERGTRYEKLSHRSIAILGDTATVALVCERTPRRGDRAEKAELNLRFKLSGGEWMAADYDHP
jgi:tetratricopeptide (TPR) repeat protein